MKNSLKSIRNLLVFIFFFIYIMFFVFSTADIEKRTKTLLDKQISYLNENYQVTTNFFKTISENIYHTVLTRPDVLELFYKANLEKNSVKKAELRQQLYKKIRPHFEQLRKSGVNILLFSFSDNRTFLRVHKLDKHSDDLSQVRYSFTYVNKNQKEVHGFEQGKISHAFRNIRPLYYKGLFLGSVDVSFSSEVMQENMRNIHGIDSHFILNKGVFKSTIWQNQEKVKYEQSIEHDDFLFSIPKQNHFLPTKLAINAELKDEINSGIQTEKAFSLYYDVGNKVYIISFLPILNIKDKQSVAYLVSYVNSIQLQELFTQHIWINILFLIALFLVILLFYRNVKHRFVLEDIIEEEVAKNREKDLILTQQSRHAQMGEMISMIAHQWRQPLATIAASVSSLKMAKALNDQDPDVDEKTLDRIEDQTQYLSTTINDFRNFFKEDKEKIIEQLEVIVNKSLYMVEDILNTDGITVERDYHCSEPISTYPNEVQQVILNLIKNAHDAINDMGIKDTCITVRTRMDSDNCYIDVCDQAGGIKEDILDKVFDAYFTTKGALNGTGLGLYMSKKIIQENCFGKLSVANIEGGVCFTISLPLTK